MIYIFQLKEKLRMVPSKLKTADEEIDECQEKYDALMQLKPLRENVRGLYTCMPLLIQVFVAAKIC
jgi:hypothetical protein